MPLKILLEKWSKYGGTKPQFLDFSLDTFTWTPVDAEAAINRPIQGWFEKYPEGTFAVAEETPGCVLLVWNKKIYPLSKNDEIVWKNTLMGRLFSVETNRVVSFEVRYMTWIRYVIRPWQIFVDLIAPDDDWGMEGDLPSFVHSTWASNKDIHEAIVRWNRRVENYQIRN